MKLNSFVIVTRIVLFYACNLESTTMSAKPYSDKGTIKVASNIYVINSDAGRIFAPIGLPTELKVDNLRVELKGTVEKDSSLPPNTEAIRLTSIRKI